VKISGEPVPVAPPLGTKVARKKGKQE
jgi:hypothetical protein